jgi:hypothetical protein
VETAEELKYVPSGEGKRKTPICLTETFGKVKVERTTFEY